jgi:hypothetical protein
MFCIKLALVGLVVVWRSTPYVVSLFVAVSIFIEGFCKLFSSVPGSWVIVFMASG